MPEKTMEDALIANLGSRGETLAIVETSCGGAISARLTAVAGCSSVFRGSYVAYGPHGNIRVSNEIRRAAGVVSDVAVATLAMQGLVEFGADWCLAESGILDPQTGRRSKKRAGLCFLAFVGVEGHFYQQDFEHYPEDPNLPFSRAYVRDHFVTAALRLALESIIDTGDKYGSKGGGQRPDSVERPVASAEEGSGS